MKRIHVVGLGPRTGSTLITEAIIACFDIDVHGNHEDRISMRPPRDGNVFVTKKNKDILVARSFLNADPDIHFICMMRDPRDAIVSKHRKAPDRYWAGLRYWNTYLRFWRLSRDHPRMLTLRYEDLVQRPNEVQRVIRGAMPFLEEVAPFDRFHEVAEPPEKSMRALSGLRPISGASVGNWRNHLPRVKGQIQLHGSISNDLIEFGYEKDRSWERILDGVEPDLSPTYWAERFGPLGVLKRQVGTYPGLLRLKASNRWKRFPN